MNLYRLLFVLLLFLFSLDVFAFSDIAVIKPVVAIDKSSRSYAASISSHITRWLNEGGIKCDEVDDTSLEKALTGRKLVFLVAFSSPTRAHMAALRKYVMRGGKVCVFYSGSADLARLVGVSVGRFKKGGLPSSFSKIQFAKDGFGGGPTSIKQDTSVIYEAFPLKGVSKAVASWRDVSGVYSGAAVIASSKGWWVTALLQGKGDEKSKAQFLLALVNKAIPGRWNQKEWVAGKARKAEDTKRVALSQTSKAGEIHAVWDHSGEGYYPGNWPMTISLLKKRGITDVFVNVAGSGFAHYNSKVLPHSSVYLKRGDQLRACIEAARGSGIRVHAWVLCFSSERASPEVKAKFVKNGWGLSNPNGGGFDYLDPSNPSVRAHVMKAVNEIALKYSVDGIHLDFVRWSENLKATERTSAAIKRFKSESKVNTQTALHAWRAKKIDTFVKGAGASIKKIRPRAIYSVAVFASYPSCIRSVGQDWIGWIDSGYVDYVVPMNYVKNLEKYKVLLSHQATSPERAKKIISGLGVTANESHLEAIDVINQIKIARNFGMAGVALFDLNATLTDEILPMLSLGIFKRK